MRKVKVPIGMRTVDILFVIILGIALGSLLGKTWATAPADLMPMQLMFVCLIWALLRGLFALLGAARHAIDWQRLLSPAHWRAGGGGLLKRNIGEQVPRRTARRQPGPQPDAPPYQPQGYQAPQSATPRYETWLGELVRRADEADRRHNP